MEEELVRLRKENLEIKERLKEAEDNLQAIRMGEVDAIVVTGPKGKMLYSLVGAEHPYQIFIENMREGSLILSNDGIILYSNPGFFEMVGYPQENVIGHAVSEFIQEEYKSYFLENLQKKSKNKLEVDFVKKDGTVLNLSLSISKGTWQDSESFCILLNDVSKLKRTQRLVETSEEITKILSTPTGLSLALNQVIESLHRFLGWEVIVLWFWNKETQSFVCLEIESIAHLDIESFKNKTKQIKLEKGTGFINTRSIYHPYWIEDVTEDFSFSRRNEAVQNNLRGAFSFPFYEGTELSGILELFRRTPFRDEVDDEMLNLFTSIGIEIGQFILHRIAEEAKIQFETVVAYSSNAIYSIDKAGIVKGWNPSAERIFGWTAEEMVGKSIQRLFPKERLAEFDEIWKLLQSHGAVEHFETDVLIKMEKSCALKMPTDRF